MAMLLFIVLLGGMFGLGAVFGGFASAVIASRIGRRRCLLFLTLPDAVGWVIVAGNYIPAKLGIYLQ